MSESIWLLLMGEFSSSSIRLLVLDCPQRVSLWQVAAAVEEHRSQQPMALRLVAPSTDIHVVDFFDNNHRVEKKNCFPLALRIFLR